MKSFLLALLFVGLVTAEYENANFIQRTKRDIKPVDAKLGDDQCIKNAEDCCLDPVNNCKKACSSLLLEKANYTEFVKFTNEHLVRSFEYLFLSAQFGTFSKDRPGFEKILHGLSDATWGKGIDMIKESAKRGVEHDFKKLSSNTPTVSLVDLNEMQALATAAEIEKALLEEAISVHRRHSHGSVKPEEGKLHGYDAGISHFIEEEIIEGKTQTVRNLVGHVNDLKNLFKNNAETFPLSLYLFDQYLQK